MTGFGATLAQWNASRTLDVSVPAGNAYLPKVSGAGDPRTDTWQEVMAPADRINSYTLNVTPTGSFSSALARARQELPADAALLWSASLGPCYEAEFQSATVASALGNGRVLIAFDNAATATSSPITEELFGTTDALTQTEAPPC